MCSFSLYFLATAMRLFSARTICLCSSSIDGISFSNLSVKGKIFATSDEMFPCASRGKRDSGGSANFSSLSKCYEAILVPPPPPCQSLRQTLWPCAALHEVPCVLLL